MVCALIGGLATRLVDSASAHVFVSKSHRVGAYPSYPGSGWIGEAYLDIPNFDLVHLADVSACLSGPDQAIGPECDRADIDGDGDVDMRDMARFQKDFGLASLVRAEQFVEDRAPDFTFRTEWIDFPAGPIDSKLDADFETVGDFLDDYIFDVSNPLMLNRPFGSIFLRFTGFVRVALEDESRVRDRIDLPVWVDFGTMGYDGYRTAVGETVYRLANVNWVGQPFFNFGPSIETLGLYPIEVTYFNSYDPDNKFGYDRAGIELYSWHGGGFPWPAGQQMVHEIRGAGTLVPPRVIYQWDDRQPIMLGDFEADADVDAVDAQWFQICFDPNVFFLPFGCDSFDFDADGNVSLDDLAAFEAVFSGPGTPVGGATPP